MPLLLPYNRVKALKKALYCTVIVLSIIGLHLPLFQAVKSCSLTKTMAYKYKYFMTLIRKLEDMATNTFVK